MCPHRGRTQEPSVPDQRERENWDSSQAEGSCYYKALSHAEQIRVSDRALDGESAVGSSPGSVTS